MPITISTTILFINAIWDCISSISIYTRTWTGRCMWLADAHLALWINEEDRANHAASTIMAILLAQWSLTRMHGALTGPMSDEACIDATATYAFEAVLVGVEMVTGNMHASSGLFVVAVSIVCWALVLRECVEEGATE